MHSRIYSGTTIGLDGVCVEVEVDIADRGFPTVTIVGLPSKAVDESKERVRSALTNTSYDMPDSRVTINLAPADIPKEGACFDLPIAVGILASMGMIKKETLSNCMFVGELSLEGNVRGVSGVIALSLLAKKMKIQNLFIPSANAKEAALVDGITVYPIRHLYELVLHLNEEEALVAHADSGTLHVSDAHYEFDFSEIRGQYHAKRAFEIVAAGFHNIHIVGPPGAGKTMLSRALPSIISPMQKGEALEVIKIHSIAGVLDKNVQTLERPYRNPHHTISRIGLIGGGTKPSPGEVSLAHNGILFLDELPEFPRAVLESLRQPLEDGVVTISRAAGTLTFPSRFILVAASNPCPCGYLGHKKKSCRCTPSMILKYRKKLSGPLLDRIDLHVSVPPVEHVELLKSGASESSVLIRKRIERAVAHQQRRFANSRFSFNSQMRPSDIKRLCKIQNSAYEFLKQVVSRFSLSARSYFKLIKVAQTISDLEGKTEIDVASFSEGLQFRLHDE